ncbi:MAG: prepilin-type N-terminal cleavage/methylation domain-containing protein [Akkermansiaceae bacterium]
MMTLSHPLMKQRNRRGFTLLEMVIVLALIGLAMGGAMALFITTSAERRLKGTAGDLELLAKRARAVSMVQQTPYAITIFSESVRLSPLVEAGYTDDQLRARQDTEEAARDMGLPAPKFSPVRESVSLEGYAVAVRRWGSDNWVSMLRNDPQVWRFDPNGVCEPMGIRVEYDDGWIEMEFHPLNASIRDRSMEAKR